jgi:hypothetical protein
MKKQTKEPAPPLRGILRIVLIIASITSLFFVPWILVWTWILPLPDTVQEQVNKAIDHGFDGIIVYVDEVMSGYYVGNDHDLKDVDYGSMLATAEDVGIFLRALNDGSLFEEGEQEIYSSVYVYGHTGWVPGYQSIARYHKDTDTVVILFNNSNGRYNWNIAEIVYSRIVKILRRKQSS